MSADTDADPPRPASPSGSRAPLAALALLAAIGGAVGRAFWRFSYDDAFITYRYARHWAAGDGLVYNRGEAVLGTTAPGYALLLGVLTRASGGRLDAPAWGTLLSLAALVAAFALAGAAAARALPPGARGGEALGARRGWTLAAAGGGVALVLRWNVEMLGTETLPILALAAAAAYLAERALSAPPPVSRPLQIAAGLAAAAAMCCRLDAALAAAAVGLVLWRARRRFPLGFGLATALPLGAWLAWLALRFGTVVPNTLAAKRGELGRALHGYAAFEWIWLVRALSAPGAAALLLLAAAGAVVAWRRGFLARPFFRAVALWLALHEIAYHLLGVPFAPWYEEGPLQALVFLAVLAAATTAVAVAAAAGNAAVSAVPARALGLAVGLILLAPLAAPSLAWVAAQRGRPPDPRTNVYARAGRYLAAQAPPADAASAPTVAAVEIGVLGYTSDLRVLDLAGLVSPQALAAARAHRLPDLVVAARPDFLVDVAAFRAPILGAVLARPEIAAGYREVAAFTAPEYGGGAVRILRRLPPAASPRP